MAFADFMAGGSGFAEEPTRAMPDPAEAPVACAKWLIEHGDTIQLNDEDQRFLLTIAAWRGKVSVKQRRYLAALCNKLGVTGPEYADA